MTQPGSAYYAQTDAENAARASQERNWQVENARRAAQQQLATLQQQLDQQYQQAQMQLAQYESQMRDALAAEEQEAGMAQERVNRPNVWGAAPPTPPGAYPNLPQFAEGGQVQFDAGIPVGTTRQTVKTGGSSGRQYLVTEVWDGTNWVVRESRPVYGPPAPPPLAGGDLEQVEADVRRNNPAPAAPAAAPAPRSQAPTPTPAPTTAPATRGNSRITWPWAPPASPAATPPRQTPAEVGAAFGSAIAPSLAPSPPGPYQAGTDAAPPAEGAFFFDPQSRQWLPYTPTPNPAPAALAPSAPPPPATPSTPEQGYAGYSDEMKAAITAFQEQQARDQRERERHEGIMGNIREVNAPRFAHGGKTGPHHLMPDGQMMAGPPMPPGIGMGISQPTESGEPTAIIGDGESTVTGEEVELVLEPTGEPNIFIVKFAEGPTGAPLKPGTIIIPPKDTPKLEQLVRANFERIDGTPMEKQGNNFVPAFKTGGKTGRWTAAPAGPPLPPTKKKVPAKGGRK